MKSRAEWNCQQTGVACPFVDPETGVAMCGRYEPQKKIFGFIPWGQILVACGEIISRIQDRDSKNIGRYDIEPSGVDGGVKIIGPRRVEVFDPGGVLVSSQLK